MIRKEYITIIKISIYILSNYLKWLVVITNSVWSQKSKGALKKLEKTLRKKSQNRGNDVLDITYE